MFHFQRYPGDIIVSILLLSLIVLLVSMDHGQKDPQCHKQYIGGMEVGTF